MKPFTFRISILLFAAGLIWPAAAHAQVVTGQISGVVSDASGGVLPGATVTGLNVDTGVSRVATTDATGRYVLLTLQRGTYRVTMEMQGFQTAVIEGLLLNIGNNLVNHVNLAVGGATEQVTVEATAPIISSTSGVLGDTIQTETIDNIPTLGRDYREFLKLVPGVRKEEGGSPRIGGQAYWGNNYNIDGMSNDAEYIGNPQMRITQDSIAEIQVSTNQYSAEYGRGVGGAVNVITHSGTNDFHGSAFYYGQDESLNAHAWRATSKPRSETKQYGATFGGPITKDKTHFFASVERIQLDRNTTLINLDGSSTVLNRPSRNTTIFGKLTHQINQQHTFNVQYLYDRALADGEGVSGTRQPSNGFERSNKAHNFIATEVGVLNDTTVNELRVMFQKRSQSTIANSDDPEEIRPSSRTGHRLGVPFGWEENKLQIADTLTKNWGNHSVKAGINLQFLFNSEAFGAGASFGQFIFDTDDAFDANVASTYPTRYTVKTGENAATLNNNIYGIFLQDSWSVSPKFTLNLGLRYDYENGEVQDVWAAGKDGNNIAPRISFAWTPDDERRWTVRGGYGRFYFRLYGNLGNNLIQQGLLPPDGLGISTTTSTLNPGYPDPSGFNPNGSEEVPQGLISGHISDAAFPEVVPYTDQISFGVGRELGPNFAVSADWVSSRGNSLARAFDTNFPDPVTGIRPQDGFLKVTRYDMAGKNWYDALLVKLTKRFSSNHSYTVAYTLSNTEDDTWPQFITQFGAGPQAWYNPGAERAQSASSGLNADDHERHRLVASGLVSLPLGFELSGVYTYHSPRRYNITTGRDNNGDQTFADRPNLSNGVYTDPGTGPGVQGNAPKNSGTGVSYNGVDARLAWGIGLGASGVRLTVLGEAFNLFNHTNIGGFFGALSSSRFGDPSFARRKRQVQLGAKVDF